MAANSKIEWTDATWNPITGCTPIAPGCKNCYAKRMAQRLRGRFGYPRNEPFRVTVRQHELNFPKLFHWRKPRIVFVCSMGDLFHKHVSTRDIWRVLNKCDQYPQHTFVILTKRCPRAAGLLEMAQRRAGEVWPPNNLLIGPSISDEKTEAAAVPYIQRLAALGCRVVVSAEPLLGPLRLADDTMHCLSWLIVGGETGPGARPMAGEWVREIWDRCLDEKVPFFFKQWGSNRLLIRRWLVDGCHWRQRPAMLNGVQT